MEKVYHIGHILCIKMVMFIQLCFKSIYIGQFNLQDFTLLSQNLEITIYCSPTYDYRLHEHPDISHLHGMVWRAALHQEPAGVVCISLLFHNSTLLYRITRLNRVGKVALIKPSLSSLESSMPYPNSPAACKRSPYSGLQDRNAA